MEKEFLKESGKYLLDLSKIVFAIALITPLAKDSEINIIFLVGTLVMSLLGLYLIKKGQKMSSEEFITIFSILSIIFTLYVHFKTKDEVKAHS